MSDDRVLRNRIIPGMSRMHLECPICFDENVSPEQQRACANCSQRVCQECHARVENCPFCRVPTGNVVPRRRRSSVSSLASSAASEGSEEDRGPSPFTIDYINLHFQIPQARHYRNLRGFIERTFPTYLMNVNPTTMIYMITMIRSLLQHPNFFNDPRVIRRMLSRRDFPIRGEQWLGQERHAYARIRNLQRQINAENNTQQGVRRLFWQEQLLARQQYADLIRRQEEEDP